MPHRLQGIDGERVLSVDDVLDERVRPHGRVVLLDDLGDWRGIGTAMFLQERGCAVTLVTSDPAAAAGLFHSAADVPARRRFAVAGGEVVTSTVMLAWTPGGARLRSVLTGAEESHAGEWLVVAETPLARTALAAELTASGILHHIVGDCVAPRRASLAIFEARRLAGAL